MKNGIITVIVFVFAIQTAFSQISWGVKGGFNFNSNGDITYEIADIIDGGVESTSGVGYHVGLYMKVKATRLYVKPELLFTHTESDYENAKFSMNKIDLPINVGFKLFGPISIYAGPSFQYIIDSKLEDTSLGEIDKDISVGGNVGLAAQFGRIGIDLRYERGFSDNEAEFLDIGNSMGTIDTRPEQIIIGLSVKI